MPFPVESILSFCYFSIKNFIYYRWLKIIDRQYASIIAVVVTAASLGLDIYLQFQYDQSLRGGPLIGWIRLPPFWVIYIASDFMTSLLLAFVVRRVDVVFAKRIVFEVGRVMLMFLFFTTFLSELWLSALAPEKVLSFWCLQAVTERDISYYYFDHGDFPSTNSEALGALTVKRNETTRSDLVAHFTEEGRFEGIYDTLGNRIVDRTMFIGISLYRENPNEYYQQIEISTRFSCPEAKLGL